MLKQHSILKMKQSQLECKKRAERNQRDRKIEKYLGNNALQEVRISNRSGSHLGCFNILYVLF